MKNSFLFLLVLFFVFTSSCEKYSAVYEGKDAYLNFSADTVFFDTVFTSFGTATKHLKVYNPFDETLLINSIQLAGGQSSNFRINVDGRSSTYISNIELFPKDSIFIFLEATIDPTSQNAPLLVRDSLVFDVNSNAQNVKILAWGQDVHLLKGGEISDLTWTAEKPYLIFDTVWVKESDVLSVSPGAQIYFHKKAYLYVFGTLEAIGSKDEPIEIRGDRLESFYDDIPGQWGAIYLFGKENRIDWTNISQGELGLVLNKLEGQAIPDLEISNSIIQHTLLDGLVAYNADVIAYNLLIANCGAACVFLLQSSNSVFYHSTFANYFRGIRNVSALRIQNYIVNNDIAYAGDISNANFQNCIVYGNIEDELMLLNKVNGQEIGTDFNFTFENCVLKSTQSTFDEWPDRFKQVRIESPNFVSTSTYNFRLDTLSAAKDFAKKEISYLYPFDLDANSRLEDVAPDVGAYERKENEKTKKNLVFTNPVDL